MKKSYFHSPYKFIFLLILSLSTSHLYAKSFLIDHKWKSFNQQNRLVDNGIILDVDVQFYNNRAYMAHDPLTKRVFEQEHPTPLEDFFTNLSKNGGTVTVEIKSGLIKDYKYVINMAKEMGVHSQIIYVITSGEDGASNPTHANRVEELYQACPDCKVSYWAFEKNILSQFINKLERDEVRHNIIMMGGESGAFIDNNFSQRIHKLGIKVLYGLWDEKQKESHNQTEKYSAYDYILYGKGDTLSYMQNYPEYFKKFSSQKKESEEYQEESAPHKGNRWEAELESSVYHSSIDQATKASQGKYRSLNRFDSHVQFQINVEEDGLYNLTLRVRSGNSNSQTFYFDSNAYLIMVDGERVSILGDEKSIEEEKQYSQHAYWYWGSLKANDIMLTEGQHTVTVKSVNIWKEKKTWGAVDYLSITK